MATTGTEAPTNTYDEGDLVESRVIFDDDDGTLLDPTTVAVKVKPPAGAIQTYVYGTDAALVRESAGTYRVRVTATAANIGNPGAKNTWWCKWYSTGTGQAVKERKFWVTVSRF